MACSRSNPDTKRANDPATEVVIPGIVESHRTSGPEADSPEPSAGQTLLKMEANGVSFAEQAKAPRSLPRAASLPFVPGYDVVATVCGIAPGSAGTSSAIGWPLRSGPVAGPAS